ncbi:MAG: HDIG domain-containing protein [Desulfobacterales bacterium]|nr:HDIG domain-containing protein [Desulfobacterales bacterium]
MKFFLNITLVLITLFACFAENVYLALRPPKAESKIMLTIRARQSFNFDQKKALSSKRMQAFSEFVPVFKYVPAEVEASKKKMEALIKEFLSFRAQKKKRIDDFITKTHSELGVEVSRETLTKVLRYRDLKKLLEGILTIQETILQNRILPGPQHLKGKKTIEIHDPALAAPVITPIDELISLDKARFSMEQKVQRLFWQVNESILNPVLKICQATLLPNLEFDHKENARRLDKIQRQYPIQTLRFQAGDILIPLRKQLNEQDVLLLNAFQKQQIREIYRNVPWSLFTVLFMVMFYNIFLSKMLATGSHKAPPQRPLLSLLLLCIFILKGCLLLTPLPIYAMPFAFLPLLVISLNHGKLAATGTAVVGTILVSLFAGPQYRIMLYFIFGGLTAVLVSANIQKRWHIILPSLGVGLVNSISVLAFSLDWQAAFPAAASLPNISSLLSKGAFNADLIERLGWAFAGGLVAGPLALLLLPLLEISWDTASTFKLNRYTDLQRPLMQKLLKEAPGTYQHSMAVAYLAHSVGEAIGANSLLLRIGAYYHDIGKMETPKNYIENQYNSENPHDLLDPWESTELIINHVKNGVKMGMGSRLPRALVDLILQHHGTQLIEYFYGIAAKNRTRVTLNKADFRYPGPKPQSNEAAILMIADAAEAASRSMQDPTRSKLDKMVQLIVGQKIADGQFSECNLTTRDIFKMVCTLGDALEASLHSRIRYPWQEKAKVKKRTRWTVGIGEKEPEPRSSFKM